MERCSVNCGLFRTLSERSYVPVGATNKCRLQRLPAAQHLRARRGKLPLAMSPVLAWAVGPCRRLATIGACRLLFKERPAGFLSQPRNPGRLVKRKFPLCTANRLPGTHNPSKSSAPGTLLERKFVLCTGILVPGTHNVAPASPRRVWSRTLLERSWNAWHLG